MHNSEQKLATIFETVFPDVPPEKITAASQDSIQNWDSVAAITLMNLVEEEFGIQMDFGDVADLTSFSKILEYVNERIAHTVA
jgi:acyl carrier protein